MHSLRWLAICLTVFTFSIYANNSDSCKPPPSYVTRAGDWFTRLKAVYVLPNNSSGQITTISSARVDVHPSWTGEFDVGVQFARNFGLELMVSTWHHTFWGTGPLSSTKIGSTWLLPPTLIFQWRLLSDSIVQPYLGAGGNYTLFYGISSSLSGTKLNLSHSWGPAAQAGMDLFFLPHWFFNFDVKYIWIDTHARLSGNTKGKVSFDINPWLFAIGIGRKW